MASGSCHFYSKKNIFFLFFLKSFSLKAWIVNYQPNSIEYFRDFFTLKISEEKEYLRKYKLLDYVLSFRISQTQHSKEYDNYEPNFSLYPSFFIKYFEEFSTFYGGVPVFLEGTCHTHLGAPSLSLGYGLMFKKKLEKKPRISGIAYYGFYHTVFLSDNFFLRVGFTSTYSENMTHKMPAIRWIYLSLGYFNQRISDYLGFSF
jgi:hypothetical protein